jgi:hypothetical protein
VVAARRHLQEDLGEDHRTGGQELDFFPPGPGDTPSAV